MGFPPKQKLHNTIGLDHCGKKRARSLTNLMKRRSAWKNPRNSLTWPFWKAVLPSLETSIATGIAYCEKGTAHVRLATFRKPRRLLIPRCKTTRQAIRNSPKIRKGNSRASRNLYFLPPRACTQCRRARCAATRSDFQTGLVKHKSPPFPTVNDGGQPG